MTIEEDKEVEKRVRIRNKKESYNKKAIKIGKKVLENLTYEAEMYKFYDYDHLLELLKEKLRIDIDYFLLIDIIDELTEKDKEYWMKKTKGIYFQE